MSFYSKFKDIDVYNMELHECVDVSDKNFTGSIMRVPGGWIYERDSRGYETRTSTFVPFNNEFQSVVMSKNEKLKERIRELENIVRSTLWMAKRYTDGRCTYTPQVVNECIDKALELGNDLYREDDSDRYAKDGIFGTWNPKTKKFEKE